MLALALLACAVLVPLAREYGDLRRSFRLGRVHALATTALVIPSFAVMLVLTLPLSSQPALQWLAIVGGTVALYSIAARAIVSSASSAETAPSRSTRG